MTAKASPKRKPLALVADDDAVLRGLLARALAGLGFDTLTAGSREEALSLAQTTPPDLAVLDIRMPGGGLETIAPLAEAGACVLVLTGYGSIPLAVEAMRRGATDVLTKPCEAERIAHIFQAWRKDVPSRASVPADAPAIPSLPEVEWNHLQRVLADCGGNVSAAARRLSMHRKSLQRKLKKVPPVV